MGIASFLFLFISCDFEANLESLYPGLSFVLVQMHKFEEPPFQNSSEVVVRKKKATPKQR